MAVIDPLEEVSAPTVPHNTVLLREWKPDVEGTNEGPKIASVEVGEGNTDVPLQARTIPLEEIKANTEKWRPSIEAEYESLYNTEAVEPLSEEGSQDLLLESQSTQSKLILLALRPE